MAPIHFSSFLVLIATLLGGVRAVSIGDAEYEKVHSVTLNVNDKERITQVFFTLVHSGPPSRPSSSYSGPGYYDEPTVDGTAAAVAGTKVERGSLVYKLSDGKWYVLLLTNLRHCIKFGVEEESIDFGGVNANKGIAKLKECSTEENIFADQLMFSLVFTVDRSVLDPPKGVDAAIQLVVHNEELECPDLLGHGKFPLWQVPVPKSADLARVKPTLYGCHKNGTCVEFDEHLLEHIKPENVVIDGGLSTDETHRLLTSHPDRMSLISLVKKTPPDRERSRLTEAEISKCSLHIHEEYVVISEIGRGVIHPLSLRFHQSPAPNEDWRDGPKGREGKYHEVPARALLTRWEMAKRMASKIPLLEEAVSTAIDDTEPGNLFNKFKHFNTLTVHLTQAIEQK